MVFFGSYAAVVAAYGLGLAAVRAGRVPLLLVLAPALLFRLVMLTSSPVFEDDYWRYLWDGHVLSSGVNPYRYAPADDALASLREFNWPRVGFPSVPTVYPPVAEACFAVPWLVGHPTLTTLRCLFIGCEALVVWGLIVLLRKRGRPPAAVLLYAWHPLAIREVAGNCHYEPIVLLLLVLGLYCLDAGRLLAAAAALGATVATKTYALLLAPFWCTLPAWGVLAAVVALAYAPFLGAGRMLVAGMLVMGTRWRFNGGVFEAVRRLMGKGTVPVLGFPVETARLVVVGLFAVAALWVWLRQPRRAPRTAALVLTTAALFSPLCNPWYAVWLLPFLQLESLPSGMALTLLVPASYAWYFNPAWATPAMAVQTLVVGALWLRDAARAGSVKGFAAPRPKDSTVPVLEGTV